MVFSVRTRKVRTWQAVSREKKKKKLEKFRQINMENEEIEIGRIKSPATFYFTSKKWWSNFEVDFQQMQGYFEQRPPKVCNPSTLRSYDRVLVRNWCQRNIWRRAQICKIDFKRKSCKVLFIDTGEVEEDIDLGELYHLSRTPIDWACFPPQGAKKLAIAGNIFEQCLIFEDFVKIYLLSGVKSMELDEWPISILTTTHLLKEKATKIWAQVEKNNCGEKQIKNSFTGDIIFEIPSSAKETVFENWSKHPKGGNISMRKLLIYEGFGDDGKDEGFVTAEEDSDDNEISVDILDRQRSRQSVSPLAKHKCMDDYDVGKNVANRHHDPVDNVACQPVFDPNEINFSTKPKRMDEEERRKKAQRRFLAELSEEEKEDESIDPFGPLIPAAPIKKFGQKKNNQNLNSAFKKRFSPNYQAGKRERSQALPNDSNDLRHLINARSLQKGLGFLELCKSEQPAKLQTDPKKNEDFEANSREKEERAQFPMLVSEIEDDDDKDPVDYSDQVRTLETAILEYDQDTMPALAVVKDSGSNSSQALLSTKRPTQVMWKDNETHLLLDISFRDCDLKQDLIKTFLHLSVEEKMFSMEYMDDLFSVICLKFQLSECVVPCQTNLSFRGLNLTISLKKLVPKACHAPSPFIEEGQYVKKHWIIHDPMDFDCSDNEEKNDPLHNQSLLPWNQANQSFSQTRQPIEGCLSWGESSENSFNSEDSGDNFEEYMTKPVYVFNPDRV